MGYLYRHGDVDAFFISMGRIFVKSRSTPPRPRSEVVKRVPMFVTARNLVVVRGSTIFKGDVVELCSVMTEKNDMIRVKVKNDYHVVDSIDFIIPSQYIHG